MQSRINLTTTVMAPACGRMTGSAASGSWENCMANEHTSIANLRLNYFIIIFIFAGWLRILDASMLDNQELTVIKKLYLKCLYVRIVSLQLCQISKNLNSCEIYVKNLYFKC
jgi:hypothetical protein